MASSASGTRETRNPMTGICLDGAEDRIPLAMARQETPRYDVNKDVNQVPKYTREYLEILSRTLNARLKTIDDDAVHYQETLARTRRIHKCVMAVLIVLGLLWFVTSIIILIVVFKGRAFH